MSSIALSSCGLERAASISENDFTFIGNGYQIECTKFQAAFISPRVHLLLRQDNTINSFSIDVGPEGADGRRLMGLFEDLMRGSAIVPSLSDLAAVFEVAASLDNRELMNRLCEDEGEIEIKTVCRRLAKGHCCGRSIEDEITFAASRFHELALEDLKDLDICILERILSSTSLRLKDEDSLLEFIGQIGRNGPILLRYVHSEYLQSESMTVFLDSLSPSDLDPVIWSSLCRRLLLPVVYERANNSEIARSRFLNGDLFLGLGTPRRLGMWFPMKEVKSVDGVMAYLTRTHGNVHVKGIVTITSKSLGHNDQNGVQRPLPIGPPSDLSTAGGASTQRRDRANG
jgi:hypothetical protein